MAASLLEQGQGKNRQGQSLVDSLKDSVVFRLEGGRKYVSGLSYRASVWGGYLMTSQTRTLSAVLKALTLADPEDAGLEPLSDYLLRRGGGNGWGSTADTVEAVSALLTLATREQTGPGPEGRYSLFFGSREVVFDAQGRLFAGYSSDPGPGGSDQAPSPRAVALHDRPVPVGHSSLSKGGPEQRFRGEPGVSDRRG